MVACAVLTLAVTAMLALPLDGRGTREIKLWPGKAPGETKDIAPEGLQKPKKGQARREAARERERADHHHLLAAEGQGQRRVRSSSRRAAGTTSSPSSTKAPTCASG